MSKRRKYDTRNKRSFIIIIILSIVIVGIFSLFIYNYSKASKIEYLIEAGSVLQDVEKNFINLDDDAILKIRWDGNYYLNYNKSKISLGKKVIAFNSLTGVLKMYGTFYQIANDGKIIENKNENILENTNYPMFYKLDDREYLLVDEKIRSNDNSIETSNYLLVELDRIGNAKLSNDLINLKTISPTVLVTSEYTFDIANEILNFGEYDIDLKKIIGSTNQYVPESEKGNSDEEKENDDNSNGNNGPINNPINGNGSGNSNVSRPGDVINNSNVGEVPDIDINKFKNSSIINIIEGVSQIDVDYVIYDPYNEYESVYIELFSIEHGIHNKVYLSKNENRVTFSNLVPGVQYDLNFVTVLNADDSVPETEYFDVETKPVNYSMSIYKVMLSDSKLISKISLQDDFEVDSINIVIDIVNENVDNSCLDDDDDPVTLSDDDFYRGYVLKEIDVSNCHIDENTYIYLTVDSVLKGDNLIKIGTKSSYNFGGSQ